jgi:hypothetical protein
MNGLLSTYGLARGLEAVWKLHLDAAGAYHGGYLRRAQILIETTDAAARLIRHAAKVEPSKVYGMNHVPVFRTMLAAMATALGALGIFFLSYSGMTAPLGDDAVMSLAIASMIAWFVEKSDARS